MQSGRGSNEEEEPKKELVSIPTATETEAAAAAAASCVKAASLHFAAAATFFGQTEGMRRRRFSAGRYASHYRQLDLTKPVNIYRSFQTILPMSLTM